MLSPWVRTRLLPEWTLLSAVLKHHSAASAAKFIDEVCWRTYWKGWLERHPSVWDNYLIELKSAKSEHANNRLYHAALRAESGIDCLDLWTQELLETGYLHNHARMWFASIWIHTLKLPWTLGAAFFLKHLFDGDPASNTLSWRWVAGLHTVGKTYLATAENIEKYTGSRILTSAHLASEPITLENTASNAPLVDLRPLLSIPQNGRIGLLMSEDDLSAREWISKQLELKSFAGLIPQAAYAQHEISNRVYEFRASGLRSSLDHHEPIYTDIDAVIAWAMQHQLEYVCISEPTIGIWNAITPALTAGLKQQNIQLIPIRHWFDQHFYPKACRGFFRFKKAIPAVLERL